MHALVGTISPAFFKNEFRMPALNFVMPDHSASLVEQDRSEDADWVAVLQKAVQEGIVDIDAKRFKTFESRQSLRDHLQSIAVKVRTVQ